MAMIVVVPLAPADVASPLEPAALLIVATDPGEALHVTDDDISIVLPSEKVPMAVNGWDPPGTITGFRGVTAIDASVVFVTVSDFVPETVPTVAEIVAEPAPAEVARPLEPAALLIEATETGEELHVAAEVISCVLLSEKVPLAVNWLVSPFAMFALVVVTAIDASVAAVTVTVFVPERVPAVALTVAEPAATDVASPLEPAALLIVATEPGEELQVTADDISCVLLSEKVPVAVNWLVPPFAMFGLVVVTAIDVSVAAVTVNAFVPETFPTAAVITVEPAATDVARPLEPAALLIVATDPAEELHVT